MRKESAETVAKLICQADAVLVGAGSGLSSAAGYNHYHRNAVFEASGQKAAPAGTGCGRYVAKRDQTSLLEYDR